MDADSPEALSKSAVSLYRANRHEEALKVCLLLAESSQAPPFILSTIGTMYYLGRGTRVDQEEGLRWFRRAADAGDPSALHFLSGFELKAGRYDEARAMLDRAASQGYTRALIQLGHMYDRGIGVPRDSREARQYYEEAASRGYVFAKRMIASQLLRGEDGLRGIPRAFLMFLWGLVEIVRSKIRDPYSDKIKR